MKKLISLVLALTCAAALLVGCGSDSSPPRAVPLPRADPPPRRAACRAPSAQRLHLDGERHRRTVRGLHVGDSGVTVSYDPTGSGTGIQAVLDGTTDIGLSSRALKDEEKSEGPR